MLVKTALDHIGKDVPLLICEQGGVRPDILGRQSFGILVGPEGGWTDEEKGLFTERNLAHLGLGQFTLRAETAAVVAAGIALQS